MNHSPGLDAPSETDPLQASITSARVETGEHGNGEKHAEVSPLELFSDLAMVVAIHIAAEPLEEKEGDWQVMAAYLFRVFLLWYTWHNSMIVTNVAKLFKEHKLGIDAHFFVFIQMTFILGISKFCKSGDMRSASGVYLLGRCSHITGFHMVVNGSYPTDFSMERIQNIQKFDKIMLPTFVLVEVIPLISSMLLSGTNSENPSGILMNLAVLSILLVIATRKFGAAMFDKNPNHDQNKFFGTDHLKERYELITLIFFGELCFAAASQPGSSFFGPSFCCFMTAIGCYLFYFTAKAPNEVTPWVISASHSMSAQHCHFGIFCVIPVLGVGFVKAMELVGEATTGDEIDEHNDVYEGEDSLPTQMICYSAALFLLFSGILDSSRDRLIASTIIATLPVLGACVEFAIYFVPFLMLFVATLEIWTLKSFAKK